MNNITQTVSRLPHTLLTKFNACKLVSNSSVNFVCRRYHVSRASLYRWLKKFDGTKESLIDKPHNPLTPHPNSHTKEEINNINKLIKRNPNISMIELYGKLRLHYSYSRHAASLFRFLRKIGFYQNNNKKRIIYVPKKYNTPINIGEKMQLDVKYVPDECKTINISGSQKFYQYTIIDEASRERFIYPYKEKTVNNTVDFVKRAFIYFGYKPKTIQTDNGSEFTHIRESNLIHPLDQLCDELGTVHKLIRPRTPRHNGKVERSHRNDNERFYQYLKFYSYQDLINQMKQYLKRSNNIPMASLNYLSPIQKRQELEQLKNTN